MDAATVIVKKTDIYAVLGLLREEQGTTGFLIRRSLARMLGFVKPTSEEIDAFVRAEMREAGAEINDLDGVVRAVWPDSDATAWYDHVFEPFVDFINDPEVWDPRQE